MFPGLLVLVAAMQTTQLKVLRLAGATDPMVAKFVVALMMTADHLAMESQ